MQNYTIWGALYADGRFGLNVNVQRITTEELQGLAREARLDYACERKAYFLRKLRAAGLDKAQRNIAAQAFDSAHAWYAQANS